MDTATDNSSEWGTEASEYSLSDLNSSSEEPEVETPSSLFQIIGDAMRQYVIYLAANSPTFQVRHELQLLYDELTSDVMELEQAHNEWQRRAQQALRTFHAYADEYEEAVNVYQEFSSQVVAQSNSNNTEDPVATEMTSCAACASKQTGNRPSLEEARQILQESRLRVQEYRLTARQVFDELDQARESYYHQRMMLALMDDDNDSQVQLVIFVPVDITLVVNTIFWVTLIF